MDHPIIFARHFSRLVWLLLHEPSNTDEQKAALRALVTVSREGPVHLVAANWQLVANGRELPDVLTGVQDLTAQMIGHAVRELIVNQQAAAADLLNAARLLAAEPVPGDGGRHVVERTEAMNAQTVRFIVGATRPARPRTEPTPPTARPAVPPANDVDATALAMDLELVDPAEAEEAIAAQHGVAPVARDDSLDTAPPPPVTREVMAAVVDAAANGNVAQLFAILDRTSGLQLRTQIVDEVALLAERAAREGKAMLVADLLGGLARREAEAEEPTVKRVFGYALRRLSKPQLLRHVAMLLPRKRGPIAEYEAVLVRAGEDGADALVDQLTQATTAEDRRTYYNLLARMRAAVPALIHMLEDPRWFVARNAAELLGEMEARESEQPLARLLRHDDERVRRAASQALVRIGTGGALHAVQQAVQDADPGLRQAAAAALGQRKDAPTAATLLRALDKEEDEEVQLAIVTALGRVGSAEAVSRLAAVAEPGGRFFRKKSTQLRVAAVVGLGEARTPAALAALTALTDDREREVREAAVRALTKRD